MENKAEKAHFEMRYIDRIKREQIETYKTISTIRSQCDSNSTYRGADRVVG